MKLYQKLARMIQARSECEKSGNHEWFRKWDDQINEIIHGLPHGSGIDGETSLSDRSTGEKIIIDSSYHCMDSDGFYDGWVDFSIIVKPSLQFGCIIDVKGNWGKYKCHQIDDSLAEVFGSALEKEVEDC